MADKIHVSDFLSGDIDKGIKTLNEGLLSVNSTLEKLKKNPVNFDDIFKTGGGKEFKNNEEFIKKLTEATKGLIALEKQQVLLQKQKEDLAQKKLRTDKASIASEKEKEALAQKKLKTERDIIATEQKRSAQRKRAIAETKQQADSEMSLTQILKLEIKTEADLERQNKLLRKAKKGVNFETKEGIVQINKINAALDRNNRIIEKNADRLKKRKIGIGSYTKSILNATAALTPMTMGLSGLGMAFRAIVGISSDFEKQMSKVAAISKASKEGFKLLSDNAKELGASTMFTATEVGSLQEEYAKLGFSVNEIVAATGATLDLAAATGGSLADSAMVAGATLRGFGLDAQETKRVTDVMAASFSSSALDLSTFKESMKYVAPVAKAAGVSIEEATAMLGALADSGIKGSQAGTSLRRILTDMAATGKPASEALAEISDRGISLTDAMDEVGRSAQTSLLVLAENQDKVKGLAKDLNDADGAAKRMAEIMADNLAGDVDKANSAMEGLAITIGEGANPASRFLVQTFTKLVSFVQELFKNAQPVTEVFTEIKNVFGELWGQIGALISSFDIFNGKANAAKSTMEILGSVFRLILTPLKMTISAMVQVAKGFAWLVDNSPMVRKSVQHVINSFKSLGSVLLNIPNYLNGLFSAMGAFKDGIKDTFINTFKNIANVIKESFNFKKLITGDFSGFKNALDSLKKPASDFATNISNAFKKGFEASKQETVKAAKETIEIEKEKAKELTKINEEKNKEIAKQNENQTKENVEEKEIKITETKQIEDEIDEDAVDEDAKQIIIDEEIELEKAAQALRQELGIKEKADSQLLHDEKLEQLKSALEEEVITEQEYSDKKKEIDRIEFEHKASLMQESFGMAKDLFKENTIAYKLMATAETAIATYMGASKAAAKVELFPFNFVLAALITAQGLANIAKINGVEVAEKGMYKVLDGDRHSAPSGGVDLGESNVRAEGGEGMAIFSRENTRKHGKEIEAFTNAVNGNNLDDFYKNNMNVVFRGMEKPNNILINNNNSKMESELEELNKKQTETNMLLKRFKYVEGGGAVVDIWGNKEHFSN